MGSFIFLSEVITDLELEPDVLQENEEWDKDACGSCKECLVECPTHALISPRRLDARKCISYWTIENKGGIPEDMRAGIGDWIFGCDICQEVCPYNGLSKDTKWKDFLPEAGAGSRLSLLEVLTITSDDEFKKRFAGTPILRAKRTGLLRNACVVAGNQKFKEAEPILEKIAEGGDLLLQEHARWALSAISSS
jgi:epoxyqueuosine reductase